MSDHLLYNVTEAADQLRIGRTAIYELINTGRLRSLKIGTRRLIAHQDLEAFIASTLDAATLDGAARDAADETSLTV